MNVHVSYFQAVKMELEDEAGTYRAPLDFIFVNVFAVVSRFLPPELKLAGVGGGDKTILRNRVEDRWLFGRGSLRHRPVLVRPPRPQSHFIDSCEPKVVLNLRLEPFQNVRGI